MLPYLAIARVCLVFELTCLVGVCLLPHSRTVEDALDYIVTIKGFVEEIVSSFCYQDEIL